MHDTLIQFGQRYRRYMLTFGPLARHCPAPFWPALQSTLGRWLNPHYARKARICRALSTVTDNITPAWNAWLDSHSRFVYDLLRYASMTPRWVSDNVHIAEPERFAELCAQGGLLLTYHTHHQNTIGCVFGLSGCKSSTLAAAPENSPLFPLIGRWAQQLNRESAQHFGGGDYLFINHLRQLSAATRSKVLVTSRLMPQALLNRAHQQIPGVRREPLRGLRPEDAAGLRLAASIEQKLGDNEAASRYLSRLQATPPGSPLVPRAQ